MCHFDESDVPRVSVKLQSHLASDGGSADSIPRRDNDKQTAASFTGDLMGCPLKHKSSKGFCLIYHTVHFHRNDSVCPKPRCDTLRAKRVSSYGQLNERSDRLKSQQGGNQALRIRSNNVVWNALTASQIADRQSHLSQDGQETAKRTGFVQFRNDQARGSQFLETMHRLVHV